MPVLVADVAGSSTVPDFEVLRDRRLDTLNDSERTREHLARPYTVTAWDEFQTVVNDWDALPVLLLELRTAFAPLELYVGVGFGTVSGWASAAPINLALSGEAFERARQAIGDIKAGKGDKFRRLTRFATGSERHDRLLNLVYGLHDTLLQQISERQWEMIAAAAAADSQEAVARRFDVEPSTVTRNLRRGHYWQLRETVEMLTQEMAHGALALDGAISG